MSLRGIELRIGSRWSKPCVRLSRKRNEDEVASVKGLQTEVVADVWVRVVSDFVAPARRREGVGCGNRVGRTRKFNELSRGLGDA